MVKFELLVLIYLFNNCENASDLNINYKCIDCDNNLMTEYQYFLKQINNKTFEKNFVPKNRLNLSHTSIENNLIDFNDIQSKSSLNLSQIGDKLKRSAFEFLNSVNLTNDCLNAVFQWFGGFRRTELWAYQCMY